MTSSRMVRKKTKPKGHGSTLEISQSDHAVSSVITATK